MSEETLGPDLESGDVHRTDADDRYTLCDLIAYADASVETGTDAERAYNGWLDRVYRPAKEGLIDFLVWAGLLLEDADDELEEGARDG